MRGLDGSVPSAPRSIVGSPLPASPSPLLHLGGVPGDLVGDEAVLHCESAPVARPEKEFKHFGSFVIFIL